MDGAKVVCGMRLGDAKGQPMEVLSMESAERISTTYPKGLKAPATRSSLFVGWAFGSEKKFGVQHYATCCVFVY
jgi:hypothetical protein